MNTMLSEYLKSSLLPIGEDDEKLKALYAAAMDICAMLMTQPSMTSRFIIAGLDCRVPPTDPVHVKVAEVAAKHWQTMTNRLGEGPVQVHRAIILSALQDFVSKRPVIASVILLCAANLPPESFGKGEAGLIETFLKSLGELEEQRVEREWAVPLAIAFPALSGKAKKPSLVSKEDLFAGLGKAVGPSNKAEQPLSDANPQWPDSGAPWALFFAEKATDAIYKAIITGQKISGDENTELLRRSLDTLADSFNKMALRDAKCELLWIKESSYSPAARKNFAALSKAEIAIYSAIDVSRTVGASRIPSVESFLHDLVASHSEAEVTVEKMLTDIRPILAMLKEIPTLTEDSLPSTGRRSLLEICCMPEEGATFESQSGIASDFKEALPSFACRLFREVQAIKILLQ